MSDTTTEEVKELTLNEEDAAFVRGLWAEHTSLMRSTLLNKLIDDRRDIDQECGYPKQLSTEQYRLMYDREGTASRVVAFMPEECWDQDPDVVENEDPEETEFEGAFSELNKERHIWSYLSKADELSGIGQFGILLLGLDDGLPLDQPVEGINDKGEKVGTGSERKLLFLRPLAEDLVTVKGTEKDQTNPRFSQPTFYSVTFDSVTNTRTSTEGEVIATVGQEQRVHWSRVIHLADNRESSEVYGIPRMQKVFNRLYDIRKIAGGSGEMFWKGGFPGISFEMDPNARPLTTDQKTELRTELANYADGLQRYLAIQGVSAKNLTPQVADPSAHIDVQLGLIAQSLGVPKRVFIGSEQAQLASAQDTKRWNRRVSRRREKYLTPFVIRPLIDRLIALGVLPEVEEYDIRWPDMDSPSEKDQAEVLRVMTEAMAKYVGGNVDMLVPPEIFLTMFMGLEPDQVEEIMKQVMLREEEMAEEEEQRRQEEEERRRLEGEDGGAPPGSPASDQPPPPPPPEE